ncbi:hypothetical protein [Streptomyces microflavus]|uniref:hypothetical protein n=1 Tax=Streptomyces microflavus TaxID=1919 RepID=UPI00364FAD9E
MTTAAAPLSETRPRVRRTHDELTGELELLRGEIERLRAGEEPAEVGQPLTTGGHLLWVLGESTAEMRTRIAAELLGARGEAHACSEGAHTQSIRRLRQRNQQLEERLHHARQEAHRMAEVSTGAGRGVALSLSWVLAYNDTTVMTL